jgi:hypothetical protein
MNAARAVGRRIVRLEQERRVDSCGKVVWELKRIVLDNGDVLYPSVSEEEDGGDYIVRLHSLREYNRRQGEGD